MPTTLLGRRGVRMMSGCPAARLVFYCQVKRLPKIEAMSEEIVSAQAVCQALADGYDDFVADGKNDYLSFSTLIDFHLSKPELFDDQDSQTLLVKLGDILDNDHELLYEIGWDLPELLIGYYPSKSYFFGKSMFDNIKLGPIFRLFNMLARHGNPKELLLKSCELLSGLRYSALDEFKQQLPEEDQEKFPPKVQENWFNIQFHSLLELNLACLKRIVTLYPSKFLSMAISSVTKCFNANVMEVQDPTFMLKRVYVFVRDYVEPLHPDDWDPKTNKDHEIIKADEEYIQAKLLQCFLTHSVEIACKYYQTDLSVDLYRHLIQRTLNPKNKISTENDSLVKTTFYSLMDRYYLLALSHDIDLGDIFENSIVVDTTKLFDGLADKQVDQELLVSQTFEAVNKYFVETLKGFSHDKKEIPLSVVGCFTIVSFRVFDNVKLESELEYSLTVKQSLMVALRFLIPILTIREQSKSASSSQHYRSLQDTVIFWIWVTLDRQNLQNNSVHGLTVPGNPFETFTKIFLQSLVSLVSVPQIGLDRKKIILTYLLKFLTLSHEQFAWDFLISGLETCPFLSAKIDFLNVLKDLSRRKKESAPLKKPQSEEVDSLADKISKVDLNKSAPPRLPLREYINLTSERRSKILQLIKDTFKEIFDDNDSEATVIVNSQFEIDYFQLLLTYLNFVYTVREKFTLDEIKGLRATIQDHLVIDDKSSSAGNDELTSNNLKLLQLFSEHLLSYIKSEDPHYG